MVASINSNLPAAAAAMGYNNAQSTASAAMNRINTGLRINSAKDDAAGSTILTQIKTQYNSNVVAMRNTNDGVSLMQTAEVGVKAIETKVGRLRELAMAASNGTQTAASRDAMVKEVKLLLEDINTLAEKTNFNGVKLLDGSFNNATFQVGANTGDTKMASLGNASASKMGSSDTSAVTTAQNAGKTALVAGAYTLNGVLIGPSLAAADTASTDAAAGSSIAKAAAVNAKSAESGVTATVNATEVGGSSMTAGAASGSITLNNVSINIDTTGDAASSRAAVVAAINAKSAQTGVTAVDTNSDTAGVKLVAADGRNIELAFTTVTAANTGLAAAETYTGSITLNSDKAIVITSGELGAAGTGGIKDAGLTVGTFAAQTAYVSTTDTAGAASAIAAGDFTINGAIIGASLASFDTASSTGNATSGIAKAAAINALTAQTGVTATVNATAVQGTTMVGAALTGTVTINGVATATFSTTTDEAANRKATVDAINAISGQTGVVATDSNEDSKGVVLTAADGRNIDLVFGTLTAASTGLGAADTYTSSLTLSSANAFTIGAGTNANGTDNLNLEVGTYGAGRSGGSLDMIDLSTAEGAVAALTTIDNAIASLSNTKSAIGAIQKSFMSTAEDLAGKNFALKATSDTMEQSDFIADNAELAAASLRADAANYAFTKALEQQNKLQGLMR